MKSINLCLGGQIHTISTCVYVHHMMGQKPRDLWVLANVGNSYCIPKYNKECNYPFHICVMYVQSVFKECQNMFRTSTRLKWLSSIVGVRRQRQNTTNYGRRSSCFLALHFVVKNVSTSSYFVVIFLSILNQFFSWIYGHNSSYFIVFGRYGTAYVTLCNIKILQKTIIKI